MNNQFTFTMTAEQVSMVLKLLEPYAVLSANLTTQFIKQREMGQMPPVMPSAPPADAVQTKKIKDIMGEKLNA